MIGRERLHYHELRDGEEKHVHEGGDITHEHGAHFGGRYLGQFARHERVRTMAPLRLIPPRPDL